MLEAGQDLIEALDEANARQCQAQRDMLSLLLRAERDAHEARFLEWWFTDEGRRMGLQAELPSAQGAVVIKAIERMVEQVPTMPEEEHWSLPARRADALVALSSATLAADPDPDRATVVLHARLEARGTDGRDPQARGTDGVHP